MLKPENMSSSTQLKQIFVRFLLSPFPIVSFNAWITVFACLDRCLNLFQSITKHCSTRAKIFCIWNILSATFFGIRGSPSSVLWLLFEFPWCRLTSRPPSTLIRFRLKTHTFVCVFADQSTLIRWTTDTLTHENGGFRKRLCGRGYLYPFSLYQKRRHTKTD